MAGYDTPVRIPRPTIPISTYKDPTWRTGLDATRTADQKRAATLNDVIESVLKLRQTTSAYAFSGLRLFTLEMGWPRFALAHRVGVPVNRVSLDLSIFRPICSDFGWFFGN